MKQAIMKQAEKILEVNPLIQAMDIELHPQAKDKARKVIDDFATSLLLQAKIIAFRSKAETVLTNHVDEAVDIIINEKRKTWQRELLIYIGCAAFGAFIPGFISGLLSRDILLIPLFTILGFAGMFMIFWGLRK